MGLLGCVFTVTAKAPVTGVLKVKVPFAVIGRSSGAVILQNHARFQSGRLPSRRWSRSLCLNLNPELDGRLELDAGAAFPPLPGSQQKRKTRRKNKWETVSTRCSRISYGSFTGGGTPIGALGEPHSTEKADDFITRGIHKRLFLYIC